MYPAAALVAPGQMSDNGPSRAAAFPDGAAAVIMSDDVLAPPSDLSPAELEAVILRARSGDGPAQEALYNRFKRRVFAVAWRHAGNAAAAEDILQDVFVKVFTHLDDVRDAATFPAWVHRIAVNTCYSWLRQVRAQGGPAVPLGDVEGVLADVPGPETSAAGADLRRPLEEAVAALPQGLKTVFVMHDVQGFKHEEIARVLGCSAGTSKSQLFKARLRLREILRAKRVM